MILTLEEVKLLLNIGTSEKDTYINAVLPVVENDIIHYTKNDFKVLDLTSTKVLNQVITCDNELKVNDTVMFLDGVNADIPLTVQTASTTEITVIESVDNDLSERAFVKVKYPKALKMIASQMLAFKMTQRSGVTSETIGQYSITYDKTAVSAYPKEIWESLRRYSKYYKRSEA
jgi:RNA-binding protein YhbY